MVWSVSFATSPPQLKPRAPTRSQTFRLLSAAVMLNLEGEADGGQGRPSWSESRPPDTGRAMSCGYRPNDARMSKELPQQRPSTQRRRAPRLEARYAIRPQQRKACG